MGVLYQVFEASCAGVVEPKASASELGFELLGACVRKSCSVDHNQGWEEAGGRRGDLGEPQGFRAGKVCQQKALARLDKRLILNQIGGRLQVGKQFKQFFSFEENHEFLTIDPEERQGDCRVTPGISIVPADRDGS